MTDPLFIGFWIFMAALPGLLIGSFLNVCIYRLPAGLTIVHGHSFCPSCKHNLGPLDLVPVFSYLLLGRRCRYCQQPISPRYMRVELVTAIYFALAAAIWRPGVLPLPVWLGQLTKLQGSIAAFEAALLMLAVTVLAFCGFLIWAMISWDDYDVPDGVFIFTAIPILLRLALQPEKIVYHVAGMLLSLLAFAVMLLFRLLPESRRQRLKSLGLALGLLGLMAGLTAIQPVLLVLMIELLLITLRTRRSDPVVEKRASLLWRSMPLQALLISSVLWLIL
jgi:prepilin signal peptidase PulO-like enzyme (type II secretory pathway)